MFSCHVNLRNTEFIHFPQLHNLLKLKFVKKKIRDKNYNVINKLVIYNKLYRKKKRVTFLNHHCGNS